MPLPPPQPRTHLHTRSVVYRGYFREDGLWDIEAELADSKTYAVDHRERGHMPPGTPMHKMLIRVTVDDDMVIRDIVSGMDARPFDQCPQANDPMQQMVGVTLGAGWRKAIEAKLGGVRGCTHLRELLFNLATAAFQTIPNYRSHLRRQAGEPEPVSDQPPSHLGTCVGWDFDGPAVARNFPRFAGWQPLKRLKKPDEAAQATSTGT